MARALASLGVIAVGFIVFTAFTSNPFERHVPPLPDGNDLNPLLQDFGLIVHPPMLYMGYVGFSVAFAFAVAALLDGRVDRAVGALVAAVDQCRLGVPDHRHRTGQLVGLLRTGLGRLVVLGSGRERLVHALAGRHRADPFAGGHREARQLSATGRCCWRSRRFRSSLLGTFLVRSGVLTSVHAFASDPTRGIFILVFLGVVTGGALPLYAIRAPRLPAARRFAPVSRESLLLANNLLLARPAPWC